MFEEENITKPWKFTEFLGFNNKVIEPLYECKTEYEWIPGTGKADRLRRKEFTEGRDYSQWMSYIYDDLRREPELPEYDEFREKGIYKFEEGHYPISFEKSKRPGASSIPDSSGKIELFSTKLWKTPMKDFMPPIPGT